LTTVGDGDNVGYHTTNVSTTHAPHPLYKYTEFLAQLQITTNKIHPTNKQLAAVILGGDVNNLPSSDVVYATKLLPR